MTALVLYDAVTVSNLPAGGDAYGGYVGGSWPNYPDVVRRFPKAKHVSIAVNKYKDADFLDIEKGDALPSDAPLWYARQLTRGVKRPGFYCSQSNLGAVVAAMGKVGRSKYRLWSAHTGRGMHICSPSACRADATADGTQWQQNVGGHDTSVLGPTFFDAPVVVAPSGPRVHVVNQADAATGNALAAIAKTYSAKTKVLTVADLLAMNSLAPWRHRNIRVGDVVKVRTG